MVFIKGGHEKLLETFVFSTVDAFPSGPASFRGHHRKHVPLRLLGVLHKAGRRGESDDVGGGRVYRGPADDRVQRDLVVVENVAVRCYQDRVH